MIKARGFIVWGGSIVIVLGLFLIFVAAGWPGGADECTKATADAPNTCFCEAYNIEDVENHEPGVRQKVNTWFNLYAIITSLIIACRVYLDRRGIRSGNLMKSDTWVPDLYIFAVLFLGLGSMWFHASLTAWGSVLDGMSMYVFAAFLVFYSIRRLWNSAPFFWLGYAATVLLFTALHKVVPNSFYSIMVLVLAYLVVEGIIWWKTGKFLQGTKKTVLLWVFSVVSILTATFFWVFSQTGKFMCNPDGVFQPHGMLWHPLAGVMAVLLYFYWREANDSV
ncbi:MAG: ceramidase domain-containing protein [Pseudomonadota bacterium]